MTATEGKCARAIDETTSRAFLPRPTYICPTSSLHRNLLTSTSVNIEQTPHSNDNPSPSARLRLRAGAIPDHHHDHLNFHPEPFRLLEESQLGFSGPGEWSATNALPLFDSDGISLCPGEFFRDSTIGPSSLDTTLFDLGGAFVAPGNLGIGFEDSSTLTIDPHVLNASYPLAQTPPQFPWDVPYVTPQPDWQQPEQTSGSDVQGIISHPAQPSTSPQSTETPVPSTASDSSGRITPSTVTERAVLRFACKVASCSERFVERRQLDIHKSISHANYICEFCGKTYADRKSRWNHVQDVHRGVRYRCKIGACNYSTARTSNLKRHKGKMHGQ